MLPRAGAEHELATLNSWNARGGGPERLTLRDNLGGLSTSERVRAQALGGQLEVTALDGARVDGHYPVRVFATQGTNALFEVQAANASALERWRRL